MGNKKHLINVSLLIVVATIAVYYILSAIYTLPAQASREAIIIDYQFNVYFWLISFFFALIMVFMLYAAVVFRRKPDDTTDAAHIHGNMALEIVWTILPFLLAIVLGIWGVNVYDEIVSAKEGEMVIEVTGQQWAWTFSYPEQDGITSGELVVPVDQPIRFEMQATDVIHSFWVPEFRVKQDLVPGQMTTLRIEPIEIGEYKLRCAEICGFDHTNMIADVRVVSREEFVAWVQESQDIPVYAELTPEERGEIWYDAGGGFGCLGCHSVDGSVGAGPTWQGLYLQDRLLGNGSTVVADDTYLSDSILDPNKQIADGFNSGIMPQNFAELIDAKEVELLESQGVEIDIVEDLIAFIKTLEE